LGGFAGKMLNTARENSTSELKLAFLCILVGIGAGLGAVIFRYSIEFFHEVMWVHLASFLSGFSQWAIMFIPIIGMCIVWLFLRATLRKGEGHGVEEVMRSISVNDGRISGKIAPIECIASSFCMGFGGSVGPEGPMIQIGSGVGSFIGQVFNLEQRKLVLITAAGAAGGLGAIFNAPIAGVIFAMEAVLEEFNTKGFCYLVLSSVVATQITKSILGNKVLLEMEGAVWGQWPELIIFALMGIIGGLVGVSFVLFLNKAGSFISSINFVPGYVKPICGGIILGLFALYFPVVLGEGYEYINMAMDLRFTMGVFFLIVLLKIFATVVTLSFGGSGGVFAPSLVIGSMFGGGVFWLASSFLPDIVGSPETYIAVGVATILGSAFKSPITAIIMVMEITNNYAIVLPVMIASVCATFVGWALLRGCSIYNIGLIQEGIREVETDFWVPRTRSAFNYQKLSQ
jgi:CIC family chloride channel protein